jgi:hypothetical protein
MLNNLRTKIAKYHEDYYTSAHKADVAAAGGLGSLGVGLLLAVVIPPAGIILGAAGAVALTAFGIGAAVDYKKSKKLMGQETATVRNEMHQTVEGPGWALHRLNQAQARIFDAAHGKRSAFNAVADRRVEIKNIVAGEKAALDAVKVVNSEWQNVSKTQYEFLIPII